MARALSNPVILTSPEKGVDGRTTLAGARAPTIKDGRIGDFWVDTTIDEQRLYGPKTAAGWPDRGLIKGNKGWTPVFAVVANGERRVQQVVDWQGGEGPKPTTGKYVGRTGFVSVIADAIDIRGPIGLTGTTDFEELINVPVFSSVALSGEFDDLTDKPTTLAGYGIEDAATEAQGAKADKALIGLSGAQYGLDTSKTAVQNGAALDAIEGVLGEVVSIPTGTYQTDKNPFEATGKTYVGPGRLVMNGFKQAARRTFILSDPGDVTTSDGEKLFDTVSDKTETSFMYVHSTVGAVPPDSYRTIAAAAEEIHYYRTAGGSNNLPNDQAGGRTGFSREIVYITHEGQGDSGGTLYFGNISSSNPDATHFLANPAIGVFGGQYGVSDNADGAYLQCSEFGFKDNGLAISVIDSVRNYTRTNTSRDQSQVWIHDRIQSLGSAPIDAAYTPAGKMNRVLDTTVAELDGNQAAIVLKLGQRIYFDGEAEADPSGINWFSTILRDTYIHAESDGIHITVDGISRTLSPTNWVQPTFEGDWVNAPEGDRSPVKYRRNLDGDVTISGQAKNLASGGFSRLFILPEGMRPANNVSYVTYGAVGMSVISVTSGGEVIAAVTAPAGSEYFVSFDGVTIPLG